MSCYSTSTSHYSGTSDDCAVDQLQPQTCISTKWEIYFLNTFHWQARSSCTKEMGCMDTQKEKTVFPSHHCKRKNMAVEMDLLEVATNESRDG
jgi:hypothetical protein